MKIKYIYVFNLKKRVGLIKNYREIRRAQNTAFLYKAFFVYISYPFAGRVFQKTITKDNAFPWRKTAIIYTRTFSGKFNAVGF